MTIVGISWDRPSCWICWLSLGGMLTDMDEENLKWVSAPLTVYVCDLVGRYKMMRKSRRITVTLVNWYSSKSTQRELSNEYQHDQVLMVFKNLCVVVLWTKGSVSSVRVKLCIMCQSGRDDGKLTASRYSLVPCPPEKDTLFGIPVCPRWTLYGISRYLKTPVRNIRRRTFSACRTSTLMW